MFSHPHVTHPIKTMLPLQNFPTADNALPQLPTTNQSPRTTTQYKIKIKETLKSFCYFIFLEIKHKQADYIIYCLLIACSFPCPIVAIVVSSFNFLFQQNLEKQSPKQLRTIEKLQQPSTSQFDSEYYMPTTTNRTKK